ncbi:MAG TPA: hypothetical protein EYP11_02930 [Aquificaceae bacterium]|nr:hypothetical protein [Aquificaceae bacterium]
MRVLLVLYSELLRTGKENLYEELGKNLRTINRVIGLDNIYACVSSHFRDMFDRFPELCFINNLRDTPVFGAYKGLRKLRENDVLLIDGGARFGKENLLTLLGKINVTVGMLKERWSGLAFIKMRDLDYVIKSLERNFEGSILDAFRTLKDTYSIKADFVQLEEKEGVPVPGAG